MSTAIQPPAPPLSPARAATYDRQPDPSRVAETGVWIGIGTISMTFAALTSALLVRQTGAPDWQPLHLPGLLYLNTLVLLISSGTLEAARRKPATGMLHVTLVLGFLFLVGQMVAWRQLFTEQQSLASGPSSAFFYVFTALHGAHVLGGLGGLTYVRRRAHAGVLSLSTYRAAALYWHFMAMLWVYLLTVLVVRG
jgi:cytochrome c oxidase subunit 3